MHGGATCEQGQVVTGVFTGVHGEATCEAVTGGRAGTGMACNVYMRPSLQGSTVTVLGIPQCVWILDHLNACDATRTGVVVLEAAFAVLKAEWLSGQVHGIA